MLQPQTNKVLKHLARPTVRTFSAATADADKEEDHNKVSNAFKNQHIRYVPKKQLQFDKLIPDGRMALIF